MADIRHSISISAPAARIQSLVSSVAGFSEWWAADCLQKDGVAELGFFSRNTVYRFRPMKSPDEILWQCESGQEWNGTALSFRLESKGSSILVRFAHSGWQSETDYFIACNTTWGELMFRLKAAAEGKKPGPLFSMDGLAY